MQETSVRVLYVDDDEDDFVIVRDLLTESGRSHVTVDWVPDPETAASVLAANAYDVCLVDYRLGRMNGLEFVKEAIDNGFNLPFILLTGQGDRNTDLEAMYSGAADYLNKGTIDAEILERSIRYSVERTKHIQKLQEYAAQLEEQNRDLEAYTRTIAHDLNAPLGLIAGYAGMIVSASDTEITDQVRDWATTIQNQSHRMSVMIRQLLWLARIRDSSEVVERVAVEPLIDVAIERFEDRIKTRQIKIDVEKPLPDVMGHSAWIIEVFANLIGNAVKYIGDENTHPLVIIRSYTKGRMAYFSIEDNGIGIKAEDQARLFELFQRADTNNETGFGLGLSIAHRIITKLGGEVGVQSTPGLGSKFWFSLPAVI